MAQKAKLHAAHSLSKSASERKLRELQSELHSTQADLATAHDHMHQLTQGLDASNDVIQVHPSFCASCLHAQCDLAYAQGSRTAIPVAKRIQQ